MAMVLLLACLSAFSGCFIPQDEPLLPDLPPKRNSPPKIVGQRPLQQETRVTISGSCEKTRFEIDVRDDDTANPLSTLWFVDPGPASPVLRGETVSGSATRTIRTLKEPSGLSLALLPLTDGKRHRVQVFVTDGRFIDERTPSLVELDPPVTANLPDGGMLTDVAYVDSFDWLVEVTQCQQ